MNKKTIIKTDININKEAQFREAFYYSWRQNSE